MEYLIWQCDTLLHLITSLLKWKSSNIIDITDYFAGDN